MSDLRTDTEKIAHSAILATLEAYNKGPMGRFDIQELMGKLRNAAGLLTNKQYGCATGAHAGRCLCTYEPFTATRGRSIK